MKKNDFYDDLLTTVATEMEVDSLLVYELVRHQWQTAHRAFADPEINSVEISGFGTFKLRDRKLRNLLNYLYREKVNYSNKYYLEKDPKKKKTLKRHVDFLDKEVSFLENKIKHLDA